MWTVLIAVIIWGAVFAWAYWTFRRAMQHEPLPAKRQLLAPMRDRVKAHNDRLYARMGGSFVTFSPFAFGFCFFGWYDFALMTALLWGYGVRQLWKQRVTSDVLPQAQ